MRLSCIQWPSDVQPSAFSSGYCELRFGTPIGYATPPSCHSADGNGGDGNGEGSARRGVGGAFASAGGGFRSSSYAAARREPKPFEQSLEAATGGAAPAVSA